MRSRSARSPWGTRLLAAWVALSLMFALTPCCEVIGAANAAPVPVAVDRGHTSDAQAPDTGDPCAVWLDRSNVVPAKADDATPSAAKVAPATPFVFLPSASPAPAVWRPFRPSAAPPDALYLRHARLIL